MSGERAPDRRIQRTRQMLFASLIEVILEKGYEAATAQDIIDRANVGRSTFYSHFQDKEQLLMSGADGLMGAFEEFGSGSKGEEGNWEFSLALFKHAEEQRRVFRALLGKQVGKVVLERMEGGLTIYVEDHFKEAFTKKKPSTPHELFTRFLVSSFLGILTWWLEKNLPYSAEAVNGYYRELTEPTIRAMLG